MTTKVKRLIRKAGGARKVASSFGVSTQAVYQWMNGQRPLPKDKAAELKRITEEA